MKLAKVLKAATKSVIAVLIEVVSAVTLTSTGPVVVALKFSVRPSTTSLRVLLAVLIWMPLMVRSLLSAACLRSMGELAAVAAS